jgi:hypothetical protein
MQIGAMVGYTWRLAVLASMRASTTSNWNSRKNILKLLNADVNVLYFMHVPAFLCQPCISLYVPNYDMRDI